ncbi:MAG: hypothetical protein M1827_002826 [Pycnora praestabilis]|nr:MAG: hypothetical protein M1827_002826 [Pycnora praestabilis]
MKRLASSRNVHRALRDNPSMRNIKIGEAVKRNCFAGGFKLTPGAYFNRLKINRQAKFSFRPRMTAIKNRRSLKSGGGLRINVQGSEQPTTDLEKSGKLIDREPYRLKPKKELQQESPDARLSAVDDIHGEPTDIIVRPYPRGLLLSKEGAPWDDLHVHPASATERWLTLAG